MSTTQLYQVFAAIGAAFTLKAAYDLTTFLHFHFLSSPKYHRYLYGDAPYALVTGATDGIGRAVAKELYNKGFNLVIHGRNPEKLKKVQENILSSSSSKRHVRLWVADASAAEVDYVSALKEWEDIEITLVINNVGGTVIKDIRFALSLLVASVQVFILIRGRYDAIPESTLFSELRLNAIFPWLLTRALLPKLRTARGPVKVVFVGSGSGELPLPGSIPYGPTKAFLRQLSATIDADERFRQPSNVTTSYLLVGGVVSAAHRAEPSLFIPEAEPFAKSLGNKIGSERSVVVPWVWHALQLWAVGFVPESVLRKIAQDGIEEELKMLTKHK